MFEYMTGINAGARTCFNGEAIDDVAVSDIRRKALGVLSVQPSENRDPLPTQSGGGVKIQPSFRGAKPASVLNIESHKGEFSTKRTRQRGSLGRNRSFYYMKLILFDLFSLTVQPSKPSGSSVAPRRSRVRAGALQSIVTS